MTKLKKRTKQLKDQARALGKKNSKKMTLRDGKTIDVPKKRVITVKLKQKPKNQSQGTSSIEFARSILTRKE